MKGGRFSEEQIIAILKRYEAGQKLADLARETGVSEATIYAWKAKYGGLEVREAQLVKDIWIARGHLGDEDLGGVYARPDLIHDLPCSEYFRASRHRLEPAFSIAGL